MKIPAFLPLVCGTRQRSASRSSQTLWRVSMINLRRPVSIIKDVFHATIHNVAGMPLGPESWQHLSGRIAQGPYHATHNFRLGQSASVVDNGIKSMGYGTIAERGGFRHALREGCHLLRQYRGRKPVVSRPQVSSRGSSGSQGQEESNASC